MDELVQLCLRLVGDTARAEPAADEARAGGGERLAQVRRALEACRELADPRGEPSAAAPPVRSAQAEAASVGSAEPRNLAAAVAAELAEASLRLTPRHREVLALRDLGLSHGEIAEVIGVDPGGVALLLARARMDLRGELRGATAPEHGCPERERALRAIALRQDGEPVPEAEEDWLLGHLRHCVSCAQAHAAMLEAAARYRAWHAHGE